MSKGIIYFIQPAELVGTNRYKIGYSKSPNLKRCNKGYKKGSRYIFIMECNNPFILEKNIKEEFNKLFKLIAGSEYFEGDENMMRKTFLKTIEEFEESNLDNNLSKDIISQFNKFSQTTKVESKLRNKVKGKINIFTLNNSDLDI